MSNDREDWVSGKLLLSTAADEKATIQAGSVGHPLNCAAAGKYVKRKVRKVQGVSTKMGTI